MWIAFAFVVQVTLSSFTALYPDYSWILWERTVKTFVLFFVAAMLINSKVRMQALLWILAISLGYFSTKGVMDTLSSGGKNVLTGPPGTMIADNNHLALSLVILLPILNYLRATSVNKLVRLALVAVLAFTVIAIITSYSRGALVALPIAALAFLRSFKGRVLLLILLASISLFVINVMPEKWHGRVTTLESVETIQEDRSFSGRMDAWTVSLKLAMSRPLTGGGFSAVQHAATFMRFLPDATRGRAAHSIYFQVLGDHGFVGLALYLMIFISVWLHLRRTLQRARLHSGLEWANQLAKMLQISILVFLVGGAALSVAYHDLIWLILVISMNLDIITEKKIRKIEHPISPTNQRYVPQMQ